MCYIQLVEEIRFELVSVLATELTEVSVKLSTLRHESFQ